MKKKVEIIDVDDGVEKSPPFREPTRSGASFTIASNLRIPSVITRYFAN